MRPLSLSFVSISSFCADSELVHTSRGCVSGAQMTNVRDKVHADGFDALDGYDEIE